MLRLFELHTPVGLLRMDPANMLAVKKVDRPTASGSWVVIVHLYTAIEGQWELEVYKADQEEQKAVFEHFSEMLDSILNESDNEVAS